MRQLRYFVEVASAGSINSAAQRLHISQSAVSRQITELESELGVLLLRRRPEGVALTGSGSVFVAGANAILHDLDALAASVRSAADSSCTVRLGVPPSVSPMLPDAIERLGEAPVAVQLQLVEGSTFWLQQRLDGGDLGCAILTNGRASKTVAVAPLWRETLFLLGPVDSPLHGRASVTLSDLAQIPLALTPPQDETRRAIDAAFARIGRQPNVQQEHEAMTLLTTQLERSNVHTILSRTVAQHFEARFALTSVAIDGLFIERVFSTRRGAMPQQVADKIERILRLLAAERFGGDPWVRLLS